MGGKPLKRMVERADCMSIGGAIGRIQQTGTDDRDDGRGDSPDCLKLEEIHAEGTGAV